MDSSSETRPARKRKSGQREQASGYARSLIEASLDPLVTISPEGKITDVNEATIQVTGVPREELIGTDFSDYFTEPNRARNGYQRVFAEGFVTDYALTIRRRDGKLTDVLYNASLYKDARGEVLGVFAAARDVTEQQRTSRYARSLIEASLDPLVTISPDGKITDVNDAIIKATGAARAELIGTDFADYFTEPSRAREGYQRVFAEGFVTDYPLTIRHRDGRLTDVLYNASTYNDARGDVLGVFAAARDVTARKRAEQDLDRLFNLTPEFVCIAGVDGYFKRVNPTFMRVLGYSEDELLSTPFTAFNHPDDVGATENAVVDLRDGNAVIAFSNRYRCKDGSYRWLSWNAVPVPEEGLIYSVARDVTAERRVEAITSARLRLLEFATDHSVDGLLQKTLDEAEELSGSSIGFCHFLDDAQENLRLESWSTRTMTEFCKAEGQGSHSPISAAGVWVDCVHERRPVVHNDYATLAHRKGLPEGHAAVVRELVVPVMRDNKIRAILGVGNKPTDYSEEDVRAVSLLADLGWEIAERLWAEENVRQLNEELEQRVIQRTAQLEAANKELEAFSYSVSHDLRAPLRGIDGFSQALLEDYGGQLDEQGRDFLQRVRTGTQRMGQLIDDILALSRLTRTEMHHQAVDLSALAVSVVDELRTAEPNRAVDVSIQAGLTVTGDPQLLRIVLVNLLANAWKFTGTQPEPQIEFGATEGQDDNPAYFVSDNGVGFEMAYVGKLFGAFQRLHSNRDFPGSGIGLATVQRVIHRHGGQVYALGTPGKGATFSFTLPANEITDDE